MKKYLVVGILLTLVIACVPMVSSTANVNTSMTNEVTTGIIDLQPLEFYDEKCVDMVIGGGNPASETVIGQVCISTDIDGLNTYLTYEDFTDGEWEIIAYHIHIADNWKDIPQAKGNAIPGKFEYKGVGGIDGLSFPEAERYITIHVVTQTICGYEPPVFNPDYFAASLPVQVTFSVTYPVGGGPAYFPNTYISWDGNSINVPSWCVDTDHVIYQHPTQYNGNVYSSYESLPAGLVEYPENLDKVNWILNQDYVGQTSPGGYGIYTYGDVQMAIWALVEDTPSTSGVGNYDINRINEILAAAGIYGEGFQPECGDFIGIILAPVNNAQVLIAQAVLGTLIAPCYEAPIYCTETGWAKGIGFPGKDWSMYVDLSNVLGKTIQEKTIVFKWTSVLKLIKELLSR